MSIEDGNFSEILVVNNKGIFIDSLSQSGINFSSIVFCSSSNVFTISSKVGEIDEVLLRISYIDCTGESLTIDVISDVVCLESITDILEFMIYYCQLFGFLSIYLRYDNNVILDLLYKVLNDYLLSKSYDVTVSVIHTGRYCRDRLGLEFYFKGDNSVRIVEIRGKRNK